MLPKTTSSPTAGLAWMLHGVGVLSILLGCLLFYAVVVAPLSYLSRSNGSRESELEAELLQEPEVRTEHERLRTELADMERRAVETRGRIPVESNESEFYRDVTRAAEKVGLTIRDYRRGVIVQDEQVAQMQIEVAADADYESLCRFVHELASMPRLVKVADMTLTADPHTHIYPVQFRLVLYYEPNRAEPARRTNA